MKSLQAIASILPLSLSLLAPMAAVAASPSETPTRGGTLMSVESSWGASWQPHVQGGYEYENLYGTIADSLLYHDYDKGLVPWLAESYQANSDKTEYTFKLRPGITFSDGTPLDAKAVKANFDDLGLGDKSKGILPSQFFSGYLSSEVLGDLTVRAKFKAGNARIPAVVSMGRAAIVAPSTLALNAEGRSQLKNVIGSGAFTVESEKTNEEIVLKRRTGYTWAPQTSPNKGEAYLDRIVIKISQDPSVRSNALLSRQAHLVRSVLPGDEERIKRAGFDVRNISGSKTLYAWTISYRLTQPELQDQRVRQAFSIGFDRKAIAKALLSNSYRAADSLLGHDNEAFVDLSAELAYNPEKSRALLDEAGWKLNAKGIREKDGKELRLIATTNSQYAFAREYGDALVQQFAKIGVAIVNRAGDMNYFLQSAPPNGPAEAHFVIAQNWWQNGFEGGLDGRLSRVAEPEFVRLIKEEREATNPAKRIALFKAQQHHFVAGKWLGVPLLNEGQVYGVSKTVRDLSFSAAIVPRYQSAWIAPR